MNKSPGHRLYCIKSNAGEWLGWLRAEIALHDAGSVSVAPAKRAELSRGIMWQFAVGKSGFGETR